MKKHLKTVNLIIAIAILSTLSLGRVEGIEQNTLTQQTQTETIQQQTTTSQPTVSPQSTQKVSYETTHKKQAKGKTILLKFFAAMISVLLSALIILFGLKFYQKFILKKGAKSDTINYDKTLESPKDFKEAINLFLEKTDKN